MTLRKFEYLVRDIPFEMYTDHENLVYLNNPPSNKVLRWKLAIQEYDFTLDHIKGELNVVADGLSRLTEDTPTTAECWEDTEDTRPDVSQPILHEVTNQIQVGSEPRASQGHVRHGTNPNPSMTREGSKRRKMNAVVSAASLTSIDLFAPTIDQHDADLAVLVDQIMLRVPMLHPNITSPPVELPSESIATASVDDTLSTAAGTGVIGRRKRQRGKNVRQPNVEENPLPLIPVTAAERI